MKKKIGLIITILMLCLCFAGCSKENSDAEETVITEETASEEMQSEPTAVTAEAPAMGTPVETVVSSYSVLRRAGASQPLFLEEDISELVNAKAAMQAAAPDIAAAEPAPETETEAEPEEEAEVSEETTEETPEEQEETPETEETAETPAAPQPATGGGRVICIDAGHQGHQNSGKEPIGPGAAETKMKVTSGTSGVATGVSEYQLTLAVALKLQNVLQQRGYTVVMCRTSHDVNISNAERATVANNAGAAAFIRIHADGAASASAAGGSTLAPSGSNPYCASIASASQKLAKCVINSYCSKTGMKNRGVQITDSMTGLNWSQVPVTIIEMGFMTNPAEDQLMQTEAFQQSAAEGIADGIDAFMQ